MFLWSYSLMMEQFSKVLPFCFNHAPWVTRVSFVLKALLSTGLSLALLMTLILWQWRSAHMCCLLFSRQIQSLQLIWAMLTGLLAGLSNSRMLMEDSPPHRLLKPLQSNTLLLVWMSKRGITEHIYFPGHSGGSSGSVFVRHQSVQLWRLQHSDGTVSRRHSPL